MRTLTPALPTHGPLPPPLLLVAAAFLLTTSTGTCTEAYSTHNDSAPVIAWQRTYGRNLDATAAAVCATRDGGFVAAGQVRLSYSSALAYAVRTDSLGATCWETTFGDSGTDLNFSDDVFESPVRGYIVAARLDDRAALASIDSTGEVRWTCRFGDPGASVLGCAPLPSGGAALAWCYWLGKDTRMHIVGVDSTGNLLWSSASDSVGRYSGYGHLFRTADANLLVVTNWHQDGRVYGIVLLKYDQHGVLLWKRLLETRVPVRAASSTRDGGCVVAGYGAPTDDYRGELDIYLLKFDRMGQHEWTERVGWDGSEIPDAVAETPEGSFLVGGEICHYDRAASVLLLATDSRGKMEWSKAFHANSCWSTVRDLVPEENGGLVLTATRLGDRTKLVVARMSPATR